ncbi:glycoside hydrolase domain-containing protein [Streptomyces sp. 147326]|uniref:glycoside hydrolase domain-containing protein n=1 Tax=Streptomyces sp. 147326 TaxID=3074379 RepID=UPI003857323B
MPQARPSLTPLRRSLAVLAATAAVIGPSAGSAQAATPASGAGSKTVAFQGHQFKVPDSWDVVDLGADPTACVRFDRHAVYLGTPGAQQNCPTRLVGRTEALLLEPDTSGSAAQDAAVRAIDHEIVSGAKGIRVTATYGDDEPLVRTILTAAGIPITAPKRQPGVSEAPAAALPAGSANATAASGADLTNYTGKGFDACAAPDSSTMNAWRSNSPYRAVGIYIGGSNRGCSQPNLTAAWVQQQAAAGWRFMPLYVGLQANKINSPASEGRSAADDAVDKAAALGIGPGALLYYDMEGYNRAAYAGKVLAFLSAWTEQLHARGYNSAVYSSAESGIADLVANIGSYTMPDVVFTARWNHPANTDDPVLPSWAWAQHQRVHQYDGEVTETWGGKQINIDRDYLDVALGSPRTPATAGVFRPGESVFYVSDRNGGLSGYAGFGAAGDVPLAGDWNRDGKDTFGVYRPESQTFLLTNDNASVSMESRFGDVGDVPVVGDWDGDGVDTIGVYRPGDQTFYLSNDNLSVAFARRMGVEGDKPMVGDWNGDGRDTVGVYRPSDSTFYLSDSNTSANVDHRVTFGNPGDVPVKGDWNGDGTDKVGVYRPAESDFFGAAKDSSTVIYEARFGNPGDVPLTGQW